MKGGINRTPTHSDKVSERERDLAALERMKELERRKVSKMVSKQLDSRTFVAASSKRLLKELVENFNTIRR